jgi:DNA-binding NtrC family response regulator
MTERQLQALVAVQDAAHLASVSQALILAGAEVTRLSVCSPDQLRTHLARQRPSLLVLELPLDSSLCDDLSAVRGNAALVLIARQSQPNPDALLARLQPDDVWLMPMPAEKLTERAAAALAHVRQTEAAGTPAADNPSLALQLPEAGGPGEDAICAPPLMTGANPRMAEIRNIIERVAGTNVTVLIRGESGVGKEVAARLIFEKSRRRNKPFVKVNCAAIPHDLLESELFGYEAGAFTGAVRSKPGKFELADGGTLFLDEIAEMHPALQAKLLHVLQDGSFSRLGAKRDVSTDVRVLCATNKDLEERVREGLFREDLLYRINVVTVALPPLRERRDEIPVLADYLLRKYAAQFGRPFEPMSSQAMDRMLQYDWPGNIRELENLCKRFVLVGSETQILRELTTHRAEIPSPIALTAAAATNNGAPRETPRTLSLLEIGRRAAWKAERQAILETLEATHWNRREASRRLQVSYKALLNKIKQMQSEGEAVPEEQITTNGNVYPQ